MDTDRQYTDRQDRDNILLCRFTSAQDNNTNTYRKIVRILSGW